MPHFLYDEYVIDHDRQYHMFVVTMFRVWETSTDQTEPFSLWLDMMLSLAESDESLEESLVRCAETIASEDMRFGPASAITPYIVMRGFIMQ